jgi:hypothetical protein
MTTGLPLLLAIRVAFTRLMARPNNSPMDQLISGNFAPSRWLISSPSSLRLVDWNINRGLQLPGIIDFLASTKADILNLQEVDLKARRTHHLNIAEQIARKLQMNYVFGREFQELARDPKCLLHTMGRRSSRGGRFRTRA